MRRCNLLSVAAFAALPLLVVVAATMGCSSEAASTGITVTGKILKNGQPIPVQPPSGAVLHIWLLDDADPNIAFQGDYAADGTFTFEGAKAGKMRIMMRYLNEREDLPVVMQKMQSGFQGDRMTLLDRYKSKFDAQNTPVKVEVPAGGGNIGTIDIAEHLKAAGLE
jgi:hypothetical protein